MPRGTPKTIGKTATYIFIWASNLFFSNKKSHKSRNLEHFSPPVRRAQSLSGAPGTVSRAAAPACPQVAPRALAEHRSTTAAGRSGAASVGRAAVRWEAITAAPPHRARVGQRSSGSRGTALRAARPACRPDAHPGAVERRSTTAAGRSGAVHASRAAARWAATTAARAGPAPPVTTRWAVPPTATRAASRAPRAARSEGATAVRTGDARRVTIAWV